MYVSRDWVRTRSIARKDTQSSFSLDIELLTQVFICLSVVKLCLHDEVLTGREITITPSLYNSANASPYRSIWETLICKCLTGEIQGLKSKFKATCAGNLRFLVGRAAKVLRPSCRTASMPHYAHNANALALNSLNCWSADRKSIRSAQIALIRSILVNKNTKWN